MNRRNFVALAVCVLSIDANLMNAQEEKNVYADLERWFQALMQPLDQLGNQIDRARLLTYLTRLGQAFEAMITDKQEIASLLREEPISISELKIVVDRLANNVQLTKERITKVAFPLKAQLQDQGDKIASDLKEVLLERKSWVRMLQINLDILDPVLAASYAEAATDSAKALREANTQLAKSIAFIRSA